MKRDLLKRKLLRKRNIMNKETRREIKGEKERGKGEERERERERETEREREREREKGRGREKERDKRQLVEEKGIM
jgi:hypothetical protein